MEHDEDFEELELSNAQLERIDEVENAVFDLCGILTEKEDLEWDISYIGEIADIAASILVEHGFPVRYPAIVTNVDGTQYITDYHEGEERNEKV